MTAVASTPGGLALIVRGPGGGVALDVFDRGQTGAGRPDQVRATVTSRWMSTKWVVSVCRIGVGER